MKYGTVMRSVVFRVSAFADIYTHWVQRAFLDVTDPTISKTKLEPKLIVRIICLVQVGTLLYITQIRSEQKQLVKC